MSWTLQPLNRTMYLMAATYYIPVPLPIYRSVFRKFLTQSSILSDNGLTLRHDTNHAGPLCLAGVPPFV
jgi:hypothetical protein